MVTTDYTFRDRQTDRHKERECTCMYALYICIFLGGVLVYVNASILLL